MAAPIPLPDSSVDMVFSGESIEHITEAEGDSVCQEAYRILKPGGYFCLDTPNAALTRIQCPDKFIHPEHKIEYYVHELKSKLERWGFKVIEEKGLCAMPNSLQSGQFNDEEILLNEGVFENAAECYLFFLKAIKPDY
jgi:ubiquinone/menaquinone biosynthesis C-methylase UbiE